VTEPVIRIADQMERRAEALDEDTSVRGIDGAANSSIARELRRIATAIRAGHIDQIYDRPPKGTYTMVKEPLGPFTLAEVMAKMDDAARWLPAWLKSGKVTINVHDDPDTRYMIHQGWVKRDE
jgi:hypothetical protein